MRNKKVTFVTIKKELSCIIIELLANIFGKKILKILKMTFMVELPAQKNRQESQKINSNFLTQQVTLSVEKKLFFLYIHTCLFYSIRVLKSKNDMNLHFNWILFSFSRSILSSKPYVEFLIFSLGAQNILNITEHLLRLLNSELLSTAKMC